MKKWFPFLLLTLLLLPFGLEAKYRFDETVYFNLPAEEKAKWKRGSQNGHEEKGVSVTRYFLEGEDEKKWTQLIDVHFTHSEVLTKESAEEMMKDEILKSKISALKVHWQSPQDLLYERSFPTGEHEVVRMILTKSGLHRIAYVKKAAITEGERQEWIAILSKGKVGGREESAQVTKKSKGYKIAKKEKATKK